MKYEPLLSFVQIADTHIGRQPDFAHYGVEALPCLEQIVSVVNALPDPPDFLLHSGDVSEDKSPESYRLAADVLGRLRIPVYYVAGNHDEPALMRQYLNAPADPGGDPDAPLDYHFEIKGEQFVVLDTRSAEVADPLGKLSDSQLAYLRSMFTPDGPPITLLMHHAPFKMGSPWLDDNMILVNGDALHQAILPARKRLRGVFFGHLHRTCQIMRDGITYSCAGSTFAQLQWHSWDDLFQIDRDFPRGYNFVQYFPGYVGVSQYGVPDRR